LLRTHPDRTERRPLPARGRREQELLRLVEFITKM
jgi:hypothetical protein